MKCYLFFNDGYYAGESETFGRLPGNATTLPPPPGPWLKKWPRLVDGDWVMEQDHRERPKEIYGENAQEPTEYWLPGDSWDSQPRKMTRPGRLPEGALLKRPEKPEMPLSEARALALEKVDAATSKAILAGFDYEYNGQNLHFSYDSFDQQNFADSANVAAMAIAGRPGLPQAVTWNAYDGDGNLIRLELGAADFLALYTGGALAHKALRMEAGGDMKATLMSVATVAEINELILEWGI